jgi:peptidyl-prolyl cis-trans isomerase D
MALIGTLRNKMGTWVVVFVFVAIAAFVLQDLLGSNSVLLGNNDVGEIAGHSVSFDEYQAAVQEREASFIMNTNRQPTDRDMPTLRQQAWELLILKYAIQKQISKAGVEVSPEEQQDMVWGKNVDANIRQAFTDPSTGEFDKNRLVSYLKDLKSPPADPQLQGMWQEQRGRWELFQKDLMPARLRVKYENLLLKTGYVTKAEAEREYHLQTDVAEVKFVYVPYYSVSDSVANLSDADYKEYYEAHKEKYKTEETRDLRYVSFPIVASAADTAAIKEELARLTEDFKKTDDDSVFAITNSDEQNAFGTYNAGSLPDFVKSEDLQKGNVIGPFIDGGSYKMVKISDITKDTIYSARASHILIKWENPSEEAKKAAKEKARNILKDLKAGADFAAKAREFGTDGTATRGGDLGWFSTGRMVKPFETAVFAAAKPGLLNDVVETEFGYHIIKVTNVKDNTAYKVAVIEREILPSDATTNAAYRRAESFVADIDDVKEFNEKAAAEGVAPVDAKELTAGERRINTLGEARQVIQWLFRDGEVNKVSEIFEIDGQYVIAIMTGETEKGYKPLESIKEQIAPEVRKQVKAKVIIEKLKGKTGSLEEIAQAYGSDANVYTSSSLKLNSNSLPTAGFDPKAVGLAFSLANGQRSEPYAGENGVFIMEVQNKTVAPEITELGTFKSVLEQQNATGRVGFSIAEAIKDDAKIVDKRYKFY